MLCEFAQGIDGVYGPEKDLDTEIREIQERYRLLLSDEYRAVVTKRDEEIERLRKLVDVKDEQIIRAEREAEHWKARYDLLEEWFDGIDDSE